MQTSVRRVNTAHWEPQTRCSAPWAPMATRQGWMMCPSARTARLACTVAAPGLLHLRGSVLLGRLGGII